jgi:myo-inositol 2-dehydrogenase / D-chiro-inositol 1-dehydrogenase
MLGIGLVGCGRIGAMHATSIAAHPAASLAAVFDVNRFAAEAVAAANGSPVMESIDGLLSAAAVDAVLIASSTDTHADILEKAVAANKPVLCEKPIGLSLERVNRCLAAISGTGVAVQIGFVRRFDPGHKAVFDSVRAGHIGEPRQVIITSRDPGLATEAYLKVSGGIFRDMTIHDFDMARHILGEDPVEVFAVGSRLVSPALMEQLGDSDTATVVMRTASG